MRNGFGFAVSLLLSVGLLPLNSPGQTTGGAAPAQTIKFDTIPNQILGVSPFVIAAEASSGLPVSFASKTPAVCRNADDLVTLLSAGTCSITASQAGNASYNPAASVTLSFTVSQAKVSGSFMAAASSPFAVGPYGTFPDALAVGDFNGDGIPDIATSNGGAGSVTILLGNVGGGFTASTGSPIMVGQQPTSVVVGDFNGDGNQDLAVATTNNTADFNVPGSITVLLGNGSGGFTAAAGSPFTVGAYPYVVWATSTATVSRTLLRRISSATT